MNQISRIRPISDSDAARALSAETLADLFERITATPTDRHPHGARGGRHAPRRRWRAGVALAAGLAAIALLVTTIGGPGSNVGPVEPRTRERAGAVVHQGGALHRRDRPQPARRPGPLPGGVRRPSSQRQAPDDPCIAIVGRAGRVHGGSQLNQLKPIKSDAVRCRNLGGSALSDRRQDLDQLPRDG